MSGSLVPTVEDMVASSATISALDPYLVDVARRFPTHRFLGGATQAIYRAQIELLRRYAEREFGDVRAVKLLDWGAGKGHISYLLKQHGFQVTSCDLLGSDEDSAFAQVTPIIDENKIPIVPLNDEQTLPFADGAFDIVVSFGVLEHVRNDVDSLRAIKRVLKPGGVLFFSFLPYHFSWIQRLAHLRGNFYHERLYSRRDLARLATASGLQLSNVWHGQLFPKNGMRHAPMFERLDRFLTTRTPVKHLATNLEGFFVAPR